MPLIDWEDVFWENWKERFLNQKKHIVSRLPSTAKVGVTDIYIFAEEPELYLTVEIPKKDFEKLPTDLKKLLTESDDTFLYITENGEVVEEYAMGVYHG